MKNLIRSAVLIMCAGMAFAQSDQAQTSVGQPTDTNEPLYKGCLTGTKNNYILTTDDGKSYRLHSDKDIDDHINHKVEVRGTVKKEGGDRSASSAQQFQEIDVADLKSVGKESCVGPAAKEGSGSAATGGSASVSKTDKSTSEANVSGAAAPADQSSASSSTASSTRSSASGEASQLPESDQAQTDVGGKTDKDEPLFKGCVSGTKDNYTLTADNGDKYRLHSDKDINEHVGDRVEIRGTLKPEGDSKAKAGSMWKGELDVADIKTVEDGACKQNK